MLVLSDACNLRCIFCSSQGHGRKQSAQRIRTLIGKGNENLLIGEWEEPTLSPKLPYWISFAKKTGVKNVILRTNGVKLSDKKFAGDVIKSGVDKIHINFPSHLGKLADFLLQRKGAFKKQEQGIKNLIKLSAATKIALVFVITAFNYKTMAQYCQFVSARFPGIKTISFNMICIAGYVNKRKFLIPRMAQIEPHLASAVRFCALHGLRSMVDNVPLCLMNGFEHLSVDLQCNSAEKNVPEKNKQEVCKSCSLSGLCPGIRLDYAELFGCKELKPSKKSPQLILTALKRNLQETYKEPYRKFPPGSGKEDFCI
ncbi:MAG: hypothetical protein A2X34_09285 [Elusimicrobia bacterium GWC2_51_8]|nr:MAG: hypothetical protein A2X34_09285 [Elusimicrobia bacterium GWC2_51_8]OGR85882.1 MAG: hypothetical protein A2021_03320 [Elusimicrobia bacterium GWF2_52_66]HAF96135.1 hypothetical protein [Elusimicrobiota bacterium]HCE97745.1 hypothetical protein [Elusimicrobiota bacterium]